MTKKKTWQSYDTWRRVAYNEYSDSREWRYCIKLNSSYDIRYMPAPGTRIHVSGSLGSEGGEPSGGGGSGVLQYMTTNLNLSNAPDKNYSVESTIFPWDSQDAFVDRLGDYTAAGMLDRDRSNGFALDSPQASSDTQRGIRLN